MAFIIRKSPKTGFRLTQEVWTPKRRTTVVPREAYHALGIRHDMTFEEAQERVKQINIQSQIEAKKIAAASKRIADAKLIDKAYLPTTYVQSFEAQLKEDYSDNPDRLDTLCRHWRAAQRLISKLQIDPKDFYADRNRIYNEYRANKWSTSYIKAITAMLNQWGFHCARKGNSFYQPVPRLTPSLTERQVDAREDLENRRTPAEPLKWSDLKNIRSTFANEGLTLQWNWLYISLFLGLRPTETDNLKHEKYWKLQHDKEKKIDIILIYQTKLSSIPKDKRWKPIPIVFKEQKEVVELIKAKQFKRPLNKTIQRLMEGQIETYSPRKGFVDLMLERGFSLEDISTFLGHADISMTWKHYKDKFTFKLPSAG